MDFLSLAAERYSVRAFTDQQVEDKTLNLILKAGQLAPTAHNNQPQRIKVITLEAELAKVDECTPCRFGSSCVLLICYDESESWKRTFDGKDSGFVDASIVTTHMMMATADLGLGSCWVMFFDSAKTKEQFALGDNIVPVAFLPVGYISDTAAPSASHSKRNSIEDMLI